MFSVCLLAYGDYPALAQQALGSILRTAAADLIQDIRIGFNAVSLATRRAVRETVAHHWSLQRQVIFVQEQGGRNVGKYPLMRRLFYDPKLPPLADFVMWFDDDSHITALNGAAWWRDVYNIMQDCDLLGAGYRIRMRGQQHEWIARQLWCVQRPLPRRVMHFCTGGWWTARSDRLKMWNYPFPELHHNGGDSLLGELARQRSWRVRRNFADKGVAINAGLSATINAAPRRGIKSLWPGEVPGTPLPDHSFALDVWNWQEEQQREL